MPHHGPELTIPPPHANAGYAQNPDAYGEDDTGERTPVAALDIFPYCVCEDYRCQASPYLMTQLPPKMDADGDTELCFRLDYVSTMSHQRRK
jgi:hypothetical protein